MDNFSKIFSMVQSLTKISELVLAEDHSEFLILLDNKTKQVAEGEHEEDGDEAEELSSLRYLSSHTVSLFRAFRLCF